MPPVPVNRIRAKLDAVFNVNASLSEEAAIALYISGVEMEGTVEEHLHEIAAALESPDVSWRRLLFNDDYEVADLESEEAAREFARRILWEPLIGLRKHPH
jgi:hypothetical protein